MLGENGHFQRFRDTDPATSSKLQIEVAEKSQGVFLWVFLVVHSLLQGLRDRDHVSVLMRRLEEIPSDLDAFFKQMITQIEHAYRPQAAAMFQVAITDLNNLTLMMFSFLDQQDPGFGFKMSVKAVPEPEVQALLDDNAIRLKVRCKDLLEVHKMSHSGLFTTHTVQFLHRTVRDFLQTSEVQAMLAGFSCKQDTEVDHYLVNAMLAQLKMLRLQDGPVSASASSMDDFVGLGDKLIRYVAHHVPENSKEVRQELEKVMREHKTTYESVTWHAEIKFKRIRECNANNALPAYAAVWGMREYVVWAAGNRLPKLARPLLSYAVAGIAHYAMYNDKGVLGMLDPQLVRVILKLGADPNELVDPTSNSTATIWGEFLAMSEVGVIGWESDADFTQACLQIAEHMITHGAARTAYMFSAGQEILAVDTLRKFFGEREAKRLEGLWPRENLTRRSLLKKLTHSFSKAASGKKPSRDPKTAP